MKKIFILLLVAAMAASCESFLNEDLKGDYSSENYFTGPEQAQMAVNAVYNSLYDNTEWIFGDVASDDAVKGGNAGDQAEINYINDFTAASDNGALTTYWQHRYETIARANNSISSIPGVDMSESVRNELVAEAKVLRAYAYLCLVNVFGQVPLKLAPQTTQETIHVGLSSVKDIYKQIDKDLAEAAAVLPAEQVVDPGRVTSGAANALLAKSKLFQGDYDGCLKAINALESGHTYGLEDNYPDLFKAGADKSREVVFCIQYGNTSHASLGNNMNVYTSPTVEGGYYFDAPTQAYVDCFSEKTVAGKTDPRLDASIGRDGQPWFNNTTFDASWSEATGYLVKKYDEDKSEEYAKSQSTIPQHIIRYADVLLMKAEALNEQSSSNVGAAAVELDKVRDRAGLAGTAAATQSAMRDAIRIERRRELGFEFQRFYDVMRYGVSYANEVLGTRFTERYYFPIPQHEKETNKALQ